MRLWHKDLIPYLPTKQLVSQWRECCAIVGIISKKGTLNNLLVDKIMKFHPFHFWNYSSLVAEEMKIKGYNLSSKSLKTFWDNFIIGFKNKLHGMCISTNCKIPKETIFEDWHNKRYLLQCLANLSEKYDCGGIPEDEWDKIKSAFPEEIKILYQE